MLYFIVVFYLWRIRVSIPVPLACEASALLFELIPLIPKNSYFVFIKYKTMEMLKILLFPKYSIWFLLSDIFSYVHCLNVIHYRRVLLMENPGIDPGTSRMQSERSTIWANSPDLA